VIMPAFVSGIFRVRLWVFLLGALVAGTGWVGMYVGVSYFLGADIARAIGNAGSKAVLGVIVVVGLGLGIKTGLSYWRATRQKVRLEEDSPQLSPGSGERSSR
jgi:membrane protein DedA with SNARE-associated domain